jgi:RNA polymerase sigma-70 factor (ECF subfamily)
VVTPDVERRRRFEEMSAEIFDPLQRYLRRRSLRHDADDAFSDVLLTIWRRLDDVPADNPLPWCYGVARLTLTNQRRSSARQIRLQEKLMGDRSIAPYEAPEDPELELALAAVGDDERELLMLWAWEKLEPREIAVVLGISPNAASLRLARARKHLEKELLRQNHPRAGHEEANGRKEPK